MSEWATTVGCSRSVASTTPVNHDETSQVEAIERGGLAEAGHVGGDHSMVSGERA